MESISTSNVTWTFSLEFPSDARIQLLWMVFIVTTLLLGVTGNCLVLWVYSKKKLRTSTHVLIIALAWADLFICFLKSIDIFSLALLLAGDQIPLVLFYSKPLQTTAVATSIAVTVLIAADRYDCICRPHRRVFTYRRGITSAWTAFLTSIVVNIPTLINRFCYNSSLYLSVLTLQLLFFATALVVVALCYKQVFVTIRKHVRVGVTSTTGENRMNLDNDCSTRFQPFAPNTRAVSINDNNESTFYDQSNFSSHVKMVHLKTNDARRSSLKGRVCRGLIPEIKSDAKCVLQHTKFTIQQCESSDKEQLNGNENSRIEPGKRTRRSGKSNATILQRKTTLMLFVTSVLFLLTWLPYWIHIALLIACYSGENIDPKLIDTMQGLIIVIYINATVNPLIYGIANRRFRKDCVNVLRKFKLCN